MTDGFSCADCVNKACIKSGKPCEKIEKLMSLEGIKSRDWIRPRMNNALTGKKEWREVPFSSLKNFENWGMEDKKRHTEDETTE